MSLYSYRLVARHWCQGRTQDLELGGRGGASGVSRISARGVLNVRPHTKSGGGGESFLHSCRGHSEIDKMFSHVPHARVALEEIMQ